jgi:hypothetical protein
MDATRPIGQLFYFTPQAGWSWTSQLEQASIPSEINRGPRINALVSTFRATRNSRNGLIGRDGVAGRVKMVSLSYLR